MANEKTLIEIRTGSDSDIPKIDAAHEFLDSIGVPYTQRILSAHRTPHEMLESAAALRKGGYAVSIAAAGGSAHLPGMTAAATTLPIIGLPVSTPIFRGQDSLYSMVQMPEGVPVGCVGAGQAESAAILAAQIAYINDPEIRNKIRDKRGLEGMLPSTLPQSGHVQILRPIGADLPHKKYDEMLKVLDSFEIKRKTESLSAVLDSERAKKFLRELEKENPVAIIAIGALDDENTTTFFPGIIAEQTDIPTIGLPVSRHYAGSEGEIRGDIFQNMLYNSDCDDNITGIPIAGMAVNGFKNAALFAAQIAGVSNEKVRFRLEQGKNYLAETVREKDKKLQNE
jgi:5-(carboxyamino)imidazole ribonucleotide mutase